ncbi:unnamed protein product [Linum trigynum]|uniref:rRNA methyltransferase 1, mitochondrial n=1 Tax=Linum trigynum TaxID=586398 RepID=A0AAV2GXH2_9ROSI
MCSNLARIHAFPFAIRYSSKPSCFSQFPSTKPSLNPASTHFTTKVSYCSDSQSAKAINFHPVLGSCFGDSVEVGSSRCWGRGVSGGFRIRIRSCSTSQRPQPSHGRRSVVVKDGNSLPWLRSNRVKDGGGSVKAVNEKRSVSPWEKSLQSLERVSDSTPDESSRRFGKERVERRTPNSPYRQERGRRVENDRAAGRTTRSSFGANRSVSRNKPSSLPPKREHVKDYDHEDEHVEEEVEEETEVVNDDPRWNNIKSRIERPEFQRWKNQENWGRKTWKEANTESTLPKVVGEGVYGVGPVLAALSAGRREFYALYVQQGLDLSSNNRKKKDKKGFEKVLKMAEKLGLSITEVSKHDLNMIADNRPHQGLILDASPLEMVQIKELEPVLPGEQERGGSLWVALDEVTDPQNLGAIIRSAYFFGVSGVILCAKNSAPLSGVVSKASAGSLELMELRYCKNMMQFLVLSAENGWRVVGGSVSSRAVPLNEIAPGEPTILVLGSEGTGLRPLVERSCTQLVRIPGNIPVDAAAVEESDGVEGEEEMNVEHSKKEFQSFMAVESLNVSVAAGVLLHHLIGNQPNEQSSIGNS